MSFFQPAGSCGTFWCPVPDLHQVHAVIANIPSDLVSGVIYLIGPSPRGIFTGRGNQFAYLPPGSTEWEFCQPSPGQRVQSPGGICHVFTWNGSAWIDECWNSEHDVCDDIQLMPWDMVRGCLSDGQILDAQLDLCGDICIPLRYHLNDAQGNMLQEGEAVDPCDADLFITAPSASVLRDGAPYGSVLSGGSIDVPSNCTPTTVNGAASDTPTIQVLQGGSPVGSLNPVTGVHTVPVCDGSDISVNGSPIASLPSGTDLNLPVTDQNGSPVGSWDSGDGRWEVSSNIVNTLFEYTASGVYNPPTDGSLLEVVVIAWGGGGGSGSGRRAGTGSVCIGGGAGGGGHFVKKVIRASDISGPVTITVGAGGLAGAAPGTNTSGLPGSYGGDSSFGSLVVAKGGVRGVGGGTSSFSGTSAYLMSLNEPGWTPYALRGTPSGGMESAGVDGFDSNGGPSGGSGSRRFSNGDPGPVGGDGGGIYSSGVLVPGPTVGATNNSGVDGTDDVVLTLLEEYGVTTTIGPGTAGSGAGNLTAALSTNGGKGGRGAGAGGGSGSSNAGESAGNQGGDGFVILLERRKVIS